MRSISSYSQKYCILKISIVDGLSVAVTQVYHIARYITRKSQKVTLIFFLLTEYVQIGLLFDSSSHFK
jgi:hypothetical protein